jgi:carbon storage regulator CsrA
MLILTRKEGEGFWIGPEIRVVVQNIRGGSRVSVAIHAPQSFIIQRDERLTEKKEPEGIDAVLEETAFSKGGSNL